jgi:hypothetical protein
MMEMVSKTANPSGGESERQRLERLFVSSGYAPPLATIYAVVLRPLDDGEGSSDALVKAHRNARRTLRRILKPSEEGNPVGGHVEEVLVRLAKDLFAAAQGSGAVHVERRIQRALDRLDGFAEEEVDLLPLPTPPKEVVTDSHGFPVGLWR